MKVTLRGLDEEVKAKLFAGFALTCVSTTVGILYKVSQSHGGGFHYSTTSAICIAEFVKMIMSCFIHIGDTTHHTEGKSRVDSAVASARTQLSVSAVANIWLLALMYAVNNQLSFYVYMLADPGTIYLFKAASTIIVAVIQCTLVGKEFNGDQWKAMWLQMVGMIVVQYDPCKSAALYEPRAYGFMAVSCVVTSVCAVRNEYMAKGFKVGLNVQNIVMYAGGVVMNLFAFACLPNPNSAQSELGFFDGYSSPLACGVVFCNAMIGLAITAVYKYADAITKCISSDVTAVLLVIISTFVFHLKSSITMWCGVLVVCFAVHHYTNASQAASNAKKEPEATTATNGSKPRRDEEELRTLIGSTMEDEEDDTKV